MFSTPFCQHQFTEEQLTQLEWVVCPCGNHYKSSRLREFAKAKSTLDELVQTIAAENVAHRGPVVAGAAVAPPVANIPAPYVPTKPKRNGPKISVSQWLIISASLLVLIAASVFVQGARASFTPTAWLVLESVLMAASAFGAIKGRKMSVLLSNFLAVFSSGMLMSFIMTLGTQLGLGFTEFDREPAWWWATNLTLVAVITSAAAILTKNFGWRALAPVALSIAGLLFTYGTVGEAIRFVPGAFGWQLISLSFTIIALLVQLKYLRKIKLVVDPNSENKEYEEDLHKREDASLQRFGFFTTLLLAVVGTGFTLTQVFTNLAVAFDPTATIALGLVWMLGSVTIDYWGTSLSRVGVVSKLVKTATWTISYVSIGLGVSSYGTSMSLDTSVAISLGITLLLLTLPRYARFVKPPMVALTAASWSVFGTWFVWNFTVANFNQSSSLNLIIAFSMGFALVLAISDLLGKSARNVIAGAVVHSVGLFLLTPKLLMENYTNSLEQAGSVLLIVSLATVPVLTSAIVRRRAGLAPSQASSWISVGVGFLAAFPLITSELSRNTSFDDSALTVVALIVWCAFTLLLANRSSVLRLSANTAAALTFALAGPLFLGAAIDGMSTENRFVALTLLGFAILAYSFGFIEKSSVKLYSGFGFIFLASYAAAFANLMPGDVSFATELSRFYLLFAAAPILWTAHAMLISKRLGSGRGGLRATGLSLVLLNAVIAPLATVYYATGAKRDWVFVYAIAAAVIALAVELPKLSAKFSLRMSATGFLLLGYVFALATEGLGTFVTNAQVQLLFAALATVFAWRTILATKQAAWSALAYAGALATSLAAGNWIEEATSREWTGPEIYSGLIAITFAVNGYLVNRVLPKAQLWLVSDLPVFIAVLPSLVYAIFQDLDSNENIARLLGSGLILAVYAYWRALQSKKALWTILGYSAGILAAAMTVREFTFNLDFDPKGPELYSALALATTFVGRAVLRKLGVSGKSLITWGIPLAVAILPSVFYSYDAITAQFETLDALQVTRVIAVIAVSIVSLALGMRAGNLGAATVGTAGLTLAAIPNLWFRFDGVAQGNTTVELRSLLLGGMLALIFGVLKGFKFMRGNSLIFIGIPTSVALAPAVANALIALGNPTFTTIDWWRFGIVLSISLALLVVGSLRELAGMFYPGFAGVLVAALPYGFRPVEGAGWMLWLVLLLVAGTLIWIAMRLEKMRKLGRTPAVWLKELK